MTTAFTDLDHAAADMQRAEELLTGYGDHVCLWCHDHLPEYLEGGQDTPCPTWAIVALRARIAALWREMARTTPS